MEHRSTVYTMHKLEINILKCRNIFSRANYTLYGIIEHVLAGLRCAGSTMFVALPRKRTLIDRCLQRQFCHFVSVYDEHVSCL